MFLITPTTKSMCLKYLALGMSYNILYLYIFIYVYKVHIGDVQRCYQQNFFCSPKAVKHCALKIMMAFTCRMSSAILLTFDGNQRIIGEY